MRVAIGIRVAAAALRKQSALEPTQYIKTARSQQCVYVMYASSSGCKTLAQQREECKVVTVC